MEHSFRGCCNRFQFNQIYNRGSTVHLPQESKHSNIRNEKCTIKHR
uniref:Uncharacterized protein n=1 Tax=Rhizophora mucronata TaxID=61149 RepID=A0A2P2KKB2_RHIMU